jgi:hypothetical protein
MVIGWERASITLEIGVWTVRIRWLCKLFGSISRSGRKSGVIDFRVMGQGRGARPDHPHPSTLLTFVKLVAAPATFGGILKHALKPSGRARPPTASVVKHNHSKYATIFERK